MAREDVQNRNQIEFIPNSTSRKLRIDSGFDIIEASVILTGTVTLVGGTTNGTVIGEGGPVNLIQRIKVWANPAPGSSAPGGWLVDCSARALLRRAIQNRSGKFFGEISGSTLGNGAAGVYPIYLSIPLSFAKKMQNGKQTSLNADPTVYSDLYCVVETGDVTDCFEGNDRVATYDLQLQWDDARLDMGTAANPVTLFQEDHLTPIQGANKRFEDGGLVSENGSLFLAMLIMAEEGASETLSDALINQVHMEGPTLMLDEFPLDIRQRMYNSGWIDPSAAANAAGLYFLDFTKGNIANANPTSGMLARFDVNNPSGAGLDALHVFTERVFQAAGN
jgi:hypothetical protein